MMELKEDFKKQGEKLDQCLQLLQNFCGNNMNKDMSKKSKTAIHVPAHIKQSVRDGYRHNMNENNMSWMTKTAAGSNLKFTSDENKGMTDAIRLYVKGQFPSVEEGVIRSGIETYYCTIKQKRNMEEAGKKQSHNKKMVRYGRKARKLQNRIKALRAKKMAVKDEEKMMEALKQEFMSSEESDSEDDTLLVTRPIPWLSEEYKKAMEKLDKKYQRDLNAQGKKLRSKRVVGRPSERPCPNKTTQLAWVFAEN